MNSIGVLPGERIYQARKAKCLTLEQLGQMTGVGKSAINKYEKGVVTNIPPERLELLANALDVTPGYLIGWSKEKPSPDSLAEIRKELSLLRAHLGKLEAMLDALSD